LTIISLDYIYTGSSGEAGNDVELLLEALKLSDYWEIKDLFNALQHEIAYLVNPQDLDQSALSFWSWIFVSTIYH